MYVCITFLSVFCRIILCKCHLILRQATATHTAHSVVRVLSVWSLSVLGTGVSPAKTHEPIEMRFGAQIRVNPRNRSVDGGPHRSREETCMTRSCADTLWTADSSLRSRWSQPVPRSRGVTQQQCVLSPPFVTWSQVLQIDLRQLKTARAYAMPLVKVGYRSSYYVGHTAVYDD